MPKLSPYVIISLLPRIKFAIVVALSYIHRHFVKLYRPIDQNYIQEDCVDIQVAAEEISRPSPSMVPVPYMSHFMSKLIKNKLPVIALSEINDQETTLLMGIDKYYSAAACAICLSCIDISQEIRLLGNCSHLYHRECIDEWIDHGHGSCPLCRLKLLLAPPNENDPWREERIAYLFGEDCVLDSF